MIYFVMACAITAWVLAVRDMVQDTEWDYVPEEYSEEGNNDGEDIQESVSDESEETR